MSRAPAVDPFDLSGFQAEDEFAPAPPAAGLGGFAPLEPTDAFAELAKLPPADAPPEALARQALAEPEPARTAASAPAYDPQLEAALGQASVPRIAIHVFCERSDTAMAAERAAADRRLARASTTVRPGGLAAAVDHYRNQATPQLVIVESGDHGADLLANLDALAESCDPGTKVVVIGAANDIALYRELMRRGVSEYLVPPLQPAALIRTVTGLYSDPSAPFVGRSIAVVGAKGGAGSSTLAHNLAFTLSETYQTQTVVADFDLAFGTAGLDFNQDPLQGVADALTQPDRLDGVLLDRMMARCGERLSLFAAPATLEHDYDIAAEAFEEVAGKIRNTAPFVIMDLPHLWSGWMRKMLLSSDEVVLVATPDLASLRNAKNIVDLLKGARPNDAPPRLVLNQVCVPNRPEIPVKDFAGALSLQPSVVVPFEPKLFGQAANNGQMIAQVRGGAKSKAVEALDQLGGLLTRREPVAPAKASPLAGLFKKK